eukprot:1665371-Amphidinium_carterae.1
MTILYMFAKDRSNRKLHQDLRRERTINLDTTWKNKNDMRRQNTIALHCSEARNTHYMPLVWIRETCLHRVSRMALIARELQLPRVERAIENYT